jgi:hypothetical protein
MHITSPQYYSLSPITVRLFLQSPLISQFHSHYFHISIKLPPNPPYKKPFPVPVDFVTTVIPCGGYNITAIPLRCGRCTGIWVVNEYHTHTPRKCTPLRKTSHTQSHSHSHTHTSHTHTHINVWFRHIFLSWILFSVGGPTL